MSKQVRKTISLIFILIVLSSYFVPESQAARTSIKVAVNPNFPPFQYLNENGEMVGLHIDIMNEIADNENLIIEYLAFNETNKSIEALENGIVDAVLGIVSKNNTNSMLSRTNDISSADLCMVVRNRDVNRVLNPDQDLRVFSVAFELGTISFSQLPQMNTGNNLVMGNQKQLYDALKSKSVDAIIGVKESIIYMLEKDGTSDSYTIVHNYISSVSYSILTRRNDRVLQNSINRGIGKILASGKYEVLVDKWITDIELEVALRTRMRKILSYIALFVMTAVFVISIIGYMNYKLKKIVDEKTEEIRKRAQQLEYESIFRQRLVELLPVGIIMLKDDGRVLTMNSIIRSLVSIDENNAGEKTWNISELNILNMLYESMKCNDPGVKERPVNVKININSENRIFRCQCLNFNIENDKIMVVEDITREEEEKQEVFEAKKSKELSRIIAGMAHEIKNPLMSINTFASLIEKQGNDDDFKELFAEHVPKEIGRINRLINMLINYTRPLRRNKERVLISELINDSKYIAKISTTNSNKIILKTEVSYDAYIYVNRDQIKQALINLILNSIQSVEEKLSQYEDKFPEGLLIRLSSYPLNKLVCIEVYDEGCGMTEAEIEKCIEPFFSTKAKGLGMGLALTKQFVNQNSGKMEFESRKNEFTSIRLLFEEDIE
ncbi:MAG: transporter substrate-binding domain-containing protein [Sedimentibacter sp.]|jgi:polar amino acid transport system substrate-binding protein|nr:transporter substrate-binding domain-containing protein [Sedimentibacter sp.]